MAHEGRFLGSGGSVTINTTTYTPALLAGTLYDPSSAVTTKSTASLLAMTAFDTTNLRLTFTVPSNGAVRVRMRVPFHGSATTAQVLLGVLEGSTVKGRVAPVSARPGNASSSRLAYTAEFVVSGLTPDASLTWDAAYGVEFAVASTALKYGGPNDTTTNNAWGGFLFEIWDTPSLLASTMYDPGTAVTNKATDTLIAMTAFDTTNLRLTFSAPASGAVRVVQQVMGSGATTVAQILLGVLDGATVRARQSPGGGIAQMSNTLAATDHVVWRTDTLVTGLTPSQSYSWDAAYSVDLVVASTAIKYGGPDNTTQDDAYGAYCFEIWRA